MLQIIGDKAIEAALGRAVRAFLDPESVEAAIVQIESSPVRSELKGLNDVIALAPNGRPVVMLALESQSYLAHDLRFHVAMGYPNVHFVRLPPIVKDLIPILSGQVLSGRPDDPLAKQLLQVPSLQSSELSIIGHHLHHALHDGPDAAKEWDPKWMPLAKVLFGDLSREELIAAVDKARSATSMLGFFAGQAFPDAVFDVEGTVLDFNGNLRSEVVQMAVDLSASHPITLCTGGDVERLGKALRRQGIAYKLIPRDLLEGARVAIVVDDRSEKDFSEQHTIRYDEYRQV